ncbi:glycosyltransferase [Chakrabartyella piscis]|uniref:glycosyltransferase n=1 Tax=Chakrabartyella piscis TaxID=2918914 RepID=UPI00295849CA|nr:glycosyltransferase [Chakrabartyella piscis]
MQLMDFGEQASKTKANQNMVIVIPSLEPDNELISYIGQLVDCGFTSIVVINDGSDDTYNAIFAGVGEYKECTVLVHKENRGKGAALKTGFAYIREHIPNCSGIITVDSDGQHAIEDVCHIAEALLQHPKTLVLGSRDFSLPHIPPKSKVGNSISSVLFLFLFGKWFGDTQTGLRGFDVSLLGKMQSIKGERFEYEMEVLAVCATEKIPIKTITICTIYEGNNEGTHYRPIQDSIRIAKVLLGSIGRYSLSSGISTIADIGIAWFLLDYLTPRIPTDHLLRIGISVVVARFISMGINYTLNRNYVFGMEAKKDKSSIKYIFG